MAKSDLDRAVEALKNKQERYTALWNYYDGMQPLVYSTERLRNVFKNINARFSQNWAAVVIDSELDRLVLKQFAVANDEGSSEEVNRLFEDTELNLDADEIHKAALVIGESFVIVWPDEKSEIEAYYNDPRLCHVFYDSEKPRQKSFAAKWWKDEDDHYNLTLYYPDRLEYYRTAKSYKDGSAEIKGSAFRPAQTPTATNTFGEIPIFHFRPDRRGVKSELVNVLEPQNAVNKLFSDMMVAAEFAAFRQRWIISNADTKAIKNAPNEVWDLPGGAEGEQGTQVGEFSATELANYLGGIENVANFIATVTRTPKHYLFDSGGQPSGEALIALEAPLNKKAQRHMSRFGATWAQVAAFMLKLKGVEVTLNSVDAIYDKPETVQPRTRAEIRQINSNAGIPLKTILREEGKSDKEIEEVEQDKADEKQAQQLSFADALLEQERRITAPNGGQSARTAVPAGG